MEGKNTNIKKQLDHPFTKKDMFLPRNKWLNGNDKTFHNQASKFTRLLQHA